MLPILLLAVSAQAHPMSRDAYSMRSAVRVAGEKIETVVILEVPFAEVTKTIGPAAEALKGQPDAAAKMTTLLDGLMATQVAGLGAGLQLQVNGAVVDGSWGPRSSPYNGKGSASEGFFMYIVEFTPASPWSLADSLTVQLTNTAWTDVQLVLSATALGGQGWTVTGSSAKDLLPDRAYDAQDPEFWIDDPRLRKLELSFRRE